MRCRVCAVFSAAAALLALLVLLGCNSRSLAENPTVPGNEPVKRQAMDFIGQSETIFGNPSCPATEVDMATVLWSYDAFLEPPDDINWVVAVGSSASRSLCYR